MEQRAGIEPAGGTGLQSVAFPIRYRCMSSLLRVAAKRFNKEPKFTLPSKLRARKPRGWTAKARVGSNKNKQPDYLPNQPDC